MSEEFNYDSMIELYLFESTTLLDNLDSILLTAEADRSLTNENINEIFRIMHTIKGSSAMMEYNVISEVSHKAEDLFATLRDGAEIDEHFDDLFDLVLRVSEFLEKEVTKIEEGSSISEESPEMIKELTQLTEIFKEKVPSDKPKMDVGRSLGGIESKPEVKEPVARQPEPRQPEPVGFAPESQPDAPATQPRQPEPRQPEPVGFAPESQPDAPATQPRQPEPRQPEPVGFTPEPQPEPRQPEPVQAAPTPQQTVQTTLSTPEDLNMPKAPEGGRILGMEPETNNSQDNGLISNNSFEDDLYENDSFEPIRKVSGAGNDSQSSLMVYNLHVHFNEGSKMENIRAFMLVNKLNETGAVERTIPDNLENNPDAVNKIIENGFYVKYTTSLFRNQIEAIAKGTLSVESISFVRKLPDENEASVVRVTQDENVSKPQKADFAPQTNINATPQQNSFAQTADTSSVVAEQPPLATSSPAVQTDNFSQNTTVAAPVQMQDNSFADNQTVDSQSNPVSQPKAELQPSADSQANTESQPSAELQPNADSQTSAELQPEASSSNIEPAQSSDTAEPPVAEKATKKEGEKTSSTVAQKATKGKQVKQNIISVDLTKLDSLLDLVGEIVITESMVTQNSDLEGLELSNFNKSARQLNKLTDELQDTVMSVRMVPVSTTFQRMRRIVRDMSKKLGKETELILIGEQTEVDKTMLDALADPLMHLVRNAMDHAIESPEERVAAGKNSCGHIILSAQNMGGDIIISVSDDGRGLDADALLAKAANKNLLRKPEADYSEKEIFNLLMMPGFSTKENVTEFSGRGVGMDVVKSNIEKIGGTVIIESVKGTGTNIILKLPLTLAIIDCMEILIGDNVYAIPISNIKESFKASAGQLISDPLGSEMIMVRGVAYPIIRLHSKFGIDNAIKNIDEGILILVDSGDNIGCLLADSLIGKFQVVVKPVPKYLAAFNVKSTGISGCTIMGNGDISLIIDVQEILL